MESFRWVASLRRAIFAVLLLHGACAVAADDVERCSAPAGTQPFEFSFRESHLRGFIDFPAGPGPHAAVLVIHGSGGTDVFHGGTEYNGRYTALRDTFRSADVATVIWDKAGNGCSTGAYSSGNPIRERAGEAVAALRALKQRRDIDASRMGLWGISQGAWAVPMAAVQDADVRFLILLSAPGRDALSQFEYQALTALRASGTPEAELRVVATHLRLAFAIMRAGGSVEDYAAALEPLQKYAALRELGFMVGTPDSYRTWQNSVDFQYRPDTALRELQQPVLAVFGDRDVLVDWRDSVPILRESLRAGGNRDLTIKVFRNADHNLMSVGPDPQFVKGYLPLLRDWLREHLDRRSP
jgi:alpha-beta hydrolase superfamily lysophospholipase